MNLSSSAACPFGSSAAPLTGALKANQIAGHSSSATVSVPNVNCADAKVDLSFSKQFETNGSVAAITLLTTRP
jgi:hypothetical protein